MQKLPTETGQGRPWSQRADAGLLDNRIARDVEAKLSFFFFFFFVK